MKFRLRKSLSVFLITIFTLTTLFSIIPLQNVALAKTGASEVNIGDYIRLGQYNGDLIWRVIDKDSDGNLMLFAEDVLRDSDGKIVKKYFSDKDNGNSLWIESELRDWLQEDFLNESFSEEEKELIKTVNHKVLVAETFVKEDDYKTEYDIKGTEAHKHSNKKISDDTVVGNYDDAYYMMVDDTVFLPSVKELRKAYDEGITIELPNVSYESDRYWLRTPRANSTDKDYDKRIRQVRTVGGSKDWTIAWGWGTPYGIRPALWLSAEATFVGDGSEDKPYAISDALEELTVSSTSPEDGETDVPVRPTIEVAFNIDIKDFTTEDIILADKNGSEVDVDINIDIKDNKKLIIKPTVDLEYVTTYTLTVAASSVKSIYDQGLQDTYTFTFTTLSEALEGEAQIGDYVIFGRFSGINLTWRVIDKDNDGNLMLFAEDVLRDLDDKPLKKRFDSKSNLWIESELRDWLQRDFLLDNFFDEEKNLIKTVNHKVLVADAFANDDDYKTKYDIKGTKAHEYKNDEISNIEVVGNYDDDDTYHMMVEDTVFLPSVKELRKAYDASITIGLPNVSYSSDRYWLRTPRADDDTTQQVRTVGSSSGWTIAWGSQSGNRGIRPALWLSAEATFDGKGSKENPYTLQGIEEKLEVISTTPEDGATDVSVKPSIEVFFNIAIDEKTTNEITLSEDSGPEVEISTSIKRNKLTIEPKAYLNPGKTHTITIPTTVKGISNQELEEEYSFSFTTEELSEYLGVSKTAPTENATEVPLDQTIEITFEVEIEAVDLELITLKAGEEGVEIKTEVKGNKLLITPTALDFDKTYTVTVPKGALKSVFEQELQQDLIFSFTTAQKAIYEEAFTNVGFRFSRGINFDSEGNVYIADSSNHRALKIDPSGKVVVDVTHPDGDRFRFPRDINVDSQGNIYVADSSGHRIVKLDSSGNHVATWGTYQSSGSGDDDFNYPNGIEIDEHDNIYITDSNNGRIKKYTPDGKLIRIIGSPGAGDGQFSSPRGLGLDSEGNLYVAEEGNRRIQKLDSDGNHIFTFYGAESMGFMEPWDVAVDSEGNIYVSDSGNHSIQKFTPDGRLEKIWGGISGSNLGEFNQPRGIAFSPDGNLYVADSSNHRIVMIRVDMPITGIPEVKATTPSNGDTSVSVDTDIIVAFQKVVKKGESFDDITLRTEDAVVDADILLAGNIIIIRAKAELEYDKNYIVTIPEKAIIDDMGDTLETEYTFTFTTKEKTVFEERFSDIGLRRPRGIDIDDNGYIYIADTVNQQIKKITPQGKVVLEIGDPGVKGTGRYQFDTPRGIAADSKGNIYVADQTNHRVLKYSPDGDHLATWGTTGESGYGDYQFNNPTSIAIDRKTDTVYVADTFERRIKKFSADGILLDIIGAGRGGPKPGSVDKPRVLTLDKEGNIYVTEDVNNRVQMFSPSGESLNVWYGEPDDEFTGELWGIAVDDEGNLYVADSDKHRIQKFSQDGKLLAQWGEYGSNPGEFDAPRGMAFDPKGRLFVLDGNNDRVQVINVDLPPPKIMPKVVSTDPVNNASGVSTSKTITVKFNVPVEKGTGTISIKETYGDDTVGASFSVSNRTMTITPNTLRESTTYTVTIPRNAIKDIDGDGLASNYTFSFKTSSRPSSGGGAVGGGGGGGGGGAGSPVIEDRDHIEADEIKESKKGEYEIKIDDSKSVSVYMKDIEELLDEDGEIVKVKSKTGSIMIPITKIDYINAARSVDATTSNAKIRVAIEKASDKKASDVEKAAEKLGAKILAEPTLLQLEIYSKNHSGKDIHVLKTYVSGIIPVDSDIDTDRAIGVLYDPEDGSFTSVPTTFDRIDGERVAVLSQQSSGIFTVIQLPEKSFKDTENHWAKKDIENLASKMIVTGKTDNLFDPNGDVTRAEFVTMIVRALGISKIEGEQNFMDVQPRVWYEDALGVAVNAGLISGYEDHSFRPNGKITRAEMATIIYRAIEFAKGEIDDADTKTSFTDENHIPAWARQYIGKVAEEGIIRGYEDGSFKPHKNASRGETAVMIARMLKTIGF